MTTAVAETIPRFDTKYSVSCNGNMGVHAIHETHESLDHIPAVAELWRHRDSSQQALFRLDNQQHAFVRRMIGYNSFDESKENKALVVEAQRIVKAVEKGEDHSAGEDHVRVISSLSPAILAFKQAKDIFRSRIRQLEKRIVKVAQELPVWESWGKGVRGFGPLALASIVAEAGDLSNYSTKGRLWKRFGLHTYMGSAPSTWRKYKSGKLTAEQWTEVGYCIRRRKTMFVVGDCLIKGNADGKYRGIYLARKERESERTETKMHAHRRAQRYMEQVFLKDLWVAWRN